MTSTPQTDGSLALRLDFGSPAGRPHRPLPATSRLRLAAGPDKYKVLEHRRRRAQIAARRLLDLMGDN